MLKMEPLRIYERSENASESDQEDLWDDKVLVKAYNKSVNEIKKKISERMCNGNPQLSELDDKEINAASTQWKSSRGNKWKEGDFCRAIYSVDGLEYEAKIIAVTSNEMCVVQFCGYGNEESVRSDTLTHSLGKKSRNAQKHAAYNDNTKISDDIQTEYSNVTVPTIPGLPSIPPPPAFTLSSEFNCDNESDALSAMLMSWYMSGYHTGFYQGLLQGKQLSKNCSNVHK